MNRNSESYVRKLLEAGIELQDPNFIRIAISWAMVNGIATHKMSDLHYQAMLILAAPKQETRGRPQDPDADLNNWFLNLACKVKAEIVGESFSKTWHAYCDRTRPKMVEDELWRCAGSLRVFLNKGFDGAVNAARIFELTENDLKPFEVVKK